jgi:DNA-directed RNA polymerase subunit RPC12/RpoP
MPRATRTQSRCARCGRPVEPGEYLCSHCREEVGPAATVQPPPTDDEREQELRRRRWPQSMVKPSPVQYHATIMVTIFAALLALGLWAFLGHRGVGPFDAELARRGPFRAGTEAVVVAVTNQGSKTGRATCSVRAFDAADTGIATVTILTPPIPPHTTIDVTQTLMGLDTEPADFETVCS